MKRTNQEHLLLILSAFGACAVAPLLFFRLIQGDWIMVAVDLAIGVSLVVLFIYTYKTRKTVYPSIILAVLPILAAITSIYVKGAVNIYWIYPTVVAAYYLLAPRWAFLLTLSSLAFLVPILYKELVLFTFISVVITILSTGIFGLFFSRSIKEQHQKLSELATKDPLTGIGNRRAMDCKLLEITVSQTRRASTVSLILLDLDHFKLINDEYGHIVGDQILVRAAEIIGGRTRVTDALYRFGGEEFVIIASDLNLNSARELAEQLRILIEKNVRLPDRTVTVSLGVAEYQKEENSESWIKRADEALYQAKDNGRNQVCIATPA